MEKVVTVAVEDDNKEVGRGDERKAREGGKGKKSERGDRGGGSGDVA